MSAAARALPGQNLPKKGPGRATNAAEEVAESGRRRRKCYLRSTKNFDPLTNQPLDNYTPRVPHMYGRLYAMGKISGLCQDKVLYYAIARTWGDPDKPVWAVFSVEECAREIGFKADMVQKAMKDLIDRGMMAEKYIGKQTRAIQVTPQNWEAAPKYEPETDESESAATESSEAEHTDESDQPETSKTYNPQTLVVMPGKKSKPITLQSAIKIKGVEEPFELKLDYRNEVPDLSLEISATAKPGGISVSIGLPQGEEIANNHRTGIRGIDSGQTHEKVQNHLTGIRRSEPEPDEKEFAPAYRKYLKTVAASRFHTTLTADFVDSVIANANGCPVELFRKVVEARLSRGTVRGAGILKELAKDAAKAHEALESVHAGDVDIDPNEAPTGIDPELWRLAFHES